MYQSQETITSSPSSST